MSKRLPIILFCMIALVKTFFVNVSSQNFFFYIGETAQYIYEIPTTYYFDSGLNAFGFLLGYKLYIYLKNRKQQSIVLFYFIGDTIYIISELLLYFVIIKNSFASLSNTASQHANIRFITQNNDVKFLIFTICRLIFGISISVTTLQTVQILYQLSNKYSEKWLFVFIPFFQIVGFGVTFAQDQTKLILIIVIICQMILYLIFQKQINYYYNKLIQLNQTNIQQLEEQDSKLMIEQNNQNEIINIIKSQFKLFQYFLIIFASANEDISRLLIWEYLVRVLYIIFFIMILSYIIDMKHLIILGQVVLIIILAIAYSYNFQSNLLANIYFVGYYIGIGTFQYPLVRVQLDYESFLNYFESYYIYVLAINSFNLSYIGVLIKFYFVTIFLNLVTTALITVILAYLFYRKQPVQQNENENEDNKKEEINEFLEINNEIETENK